MTPATKAGRALLFGPSGKESMRDDILAIEREAFTMGADATLDLTANAAQAAAPAGIATNWNVKQGRAAEPAPDALTGWERERADFQSRLADAPDALRRTPLERYGRHDPECDFFQYTPGVVKRGRDVQYCSCGFAAALAASPSADEIDFSTWVPPRPDFSKPPALGNEAWRREDVQALALAPIDVERLARALHVVNPTGSVAHIAAGVDDPGGYLDAWDDEHAVRHREDAAAIAVAYQTQEEE